MVVSNWTTDDEQYYIWNGEVRIPKTFDPSSKAAVILLGPPGGVAQIPALVKGDPGKHATISPDILFTPLEYDDPSLDSAQFTTLVAGDDDTPPVYQLTLNLHKGAPGEAGAMTIHNATDFANASVDGYLIAKTVGDTTVSWVPQKVGDQYWPASIVNTSGTDGSNRTLCSVTVPAQPFDWRPRVFGQCQIAGGTETRVDLIARLNDYSSGDVVGRSFGQVGATPPINVLVSGVPAGSGSTVGKVSAGVAAVIYLRTEQQASTNQTYSTSASTTSFMVEVAPISGVTVAGS